MILPAVFAASLALLLVHGVTAQSATGTVNGRVVWSNCIRAIPLPATPNGQAQPGVQPAPGMPQPAPTSGLPAGAVLVAVQGTAVSARTDEAGRFSLSGVPAGEYLTVAAGPVANATNAVADRPNVFVDGGQTVDIGTLSLGGSDGPYGIACRVVPGIGAAQGAETTPPDVTTPPDGSTNP